MSLLKTPRGVIFLPESLGGHEWACLPDGIVCSKCNQYFGNKVEQPALASFPFIAFRVFLGIPTKKGKAPLIETSLGPFIASGIPGRFHLGSSRDELKALVGDQEKPKFSILAHPTESFVICRMLLKMGLETIGASRQQDALGQRYDHARKFARAPDRDATWWWALYEDYEKLFGHFSGGITIQDWVDEVELSTSNVNGLITFRLKLPGMVLLVPLEPGSVSAKEDEEIDGYRAFTVQNRRRWRSKGARREMMRG